MSAKHMLFTLSVVTGVLASSFAYSGTTAFGSWTSCYEDKDQAINYAPVPETWQLDKVGAMCPDKKYDYKNNKVPDCELCGNKKMWKCRGTADVWCITK